VCDGEDAFVHLGVKIYIDTHRLNELCDTEGATKYPLGTLGTPNATPRRGWQTTPWATWGAHLNR
jgi:hypothetical protein